MSDHDVHADVADPWAESLRPVMRLDEVVLVGASTRPDHVALIGRDGTLTYAELDAAVDSVAASLRSAGVVPGARVVTSVSAGIASIIILYAVARARAVVVPINEFWTSAEVASILERSGAVHVVTDEHLGATGSPVQTALSGLPPRDRPRHGTLTGPTEISWGNSSAARSEAPLDDSLAMLLFTSGSTSQPKGALLTHEGLVGSAHYIGVAGGMDPGTRFLQILPAYHVGGVVSGFLGVHLAGGTCVVERFDPARVLALLADHSITHVAGFEAMIDSVMRHPDYEGASHPQWTTVLFAGTEQGYDKLKAAGVSHVVSAFGMTETCSDFACTRPSQTEEEIRESHWLPYPGVEVRCVDADNGRPVAAGEVGEIRVRGWNVLPSYLDGTDGRDSDGFFCTGDLGTMTANGALRFRGRMKEMIKSGGENVAAAEVEAFLRQHVPAVRTVVVVGAPDDQWGERVVAFVETEPGSSLSPEDVRRSCRGKLASFKIPKDIIQVTPGTWPLMAAGKIDRPALTRMASGGR